MNLANKVPAMLLARGDRMDSVLLHCICRFLALTGGSTMSAPTSARGVKRKCCERHQFDAHDPKLPWRSLSARHLGMAIKPSLLS